MADSDDKTRPTLRALARGLTNPRQLGQQLTNAAARNVNALLDAVERFEDKGGISGLIDEGLRTTSAAARQLSGDDKTLRQYYANLEVPYGSDRETVKRAYRALLRRYHPDKHSGDPEREAVATRLTQELTRAYDAILQHLDGKRIL